RPSPVPARTVRVRLPESPSSAPPSVRLNAAAACRRFGGGPKSARTRPPAPHLPPGPRRRTARRSLRSPASASQHVQLALDPAELRGCFLKPHLDSRQSFRPACLRSDAQLHILQTLGRRARPEQHGRRLDSHGTDHRERNFLFDRHHSPVTFLHRSLALLPVLC